MYPRISDLFYDWFGLEFSFPANTYGFFVALAFFSAFQMLRWDMRNRELRGQFGTRKERIRVKGPVPVRDVIFQLLLWGFVGYKLLYGILNWEVFYTSPQEVLLSMEGNFIGALLGAVIGGGYKIKQYADQKDEKEEFKDVEIPPSAHLGTVLTIAFVAGLLGSKVFHHLEYWDDFMRDPMGQFLSFNGLTFLGGLLTGTFFIVRFFLKKGYFIPHLTDVFAPCLILAYAVGRIGCMMAGDGDWGIANPNPMPEWLSFLPEWMWSFDFPNNVNGEGVKILPADGLPCIEGFCTHLSPRVYPTPFYETTMGLAIFGILMAIRNRMKYAGQLTGIYLFLIGIERFMIEKIRVNSTYKIAGAEITQAEIISTVLIIGGILMFVLMTYKYKRLPTPDGKPVKEPKAAS